MQGSYSRGTLWWQGSSLGHLIKRYSCVAGILVRKDARASGSRLLKRNRKTCVTGKFNTLRLIQLGKATQAPGQALCDRTAARGPCPNCANPNRVQSLDTEGAQSRMHFLPNCRVSAINASQLHSVGSAFLKESARDLNPQKLA